MKKRRKLLTWLIAGTAVFSVCSLASCTSGKKDGKTETYVVHWNSGSIGKKERDTVYTVGESLFLPQATLYDPDDEEYYAYRFVGWYYDKACTKKLSGKAVDLSYVESGELTFYAKWSDVYYVYFLTNTDEYIPTVEYAYQSEVDVSTLPTAQAKVINGKSYEFNYWVDDGENTIIRNNFSMPRRDLVYRANYNTGVDSTYELTEDGVVPVSASSKNQANTLLSLDCEQNEIRSFVDGTVFEADMTFPSEFSSYTDDCGLIFSVNANDYDPTSPLTLTKYYVMYITNATQTNKGSIDIWGMYKNDKGFLSNSVHRLAFYHLNTELKGTPYYTKFTNYMENGGETTFRYSIRQSGENIIFGVDGVEYGMISAGEKKYDTNQVGTIDQTIAQTGETAYDKVGFRSKCENIKYSNYKVSQVDGTRISLETVGGQLNETDLILAENATATVGVPTKDGYDFEYWYYKDGTKVVPVSNNGTITNNFTNTLCKWIPASTTDKNATKLSKVDYSALDFVLYAQWKKQNATPITLHLHYGQTGTDDVVWTEGETLSFEKKELTHSYSGKWYYDEAKTQLASFDAIDVSRATDGELSLYADYTVTEYPSKWKTSSDEYILGNGSIAWVGDLTKYSFETGYVLSMDVVLPKYETSYGDTYILFGGKTQEVGGYALRILGTTQSNADTRGAFQLCTYNTSATFISGYSKRADNGGKIGGTYGTDYTSYRTNGQPLTVKISVKATDEGFDVYANETLVFNYTQPLNGKYIGFGCVTADAVSFENVKTEEIPYSLFTNDSWTEQDGVMRGTATTWLDNAKYSFSEGQTLSVDITLNPYDTSYTPIFVTFGKGSTETKQYAVRILGTTQSNETERGAVQLMRWNGTKYEYVQKDGVNLSKRVNVIPEYEYAKGYTAYKTSGTEYTFRLKIRLYENTLTVYVENELLFTVENVEFDGTTIGFGTETGCGASFSHLKITDYQEFVGDDNVGDWKKEWETK